MTAMGQPARAPSLQWKSHQRSPPNKAHSTRLSTNRAKLHGSRPLAKAARHSWTPHFCTGRWPLSWTFIASRQVFLSRVNCRDHLGNGQAGSPRIFHSLLYAIIKCQYLICRPCVGIMAAPAFRSPSPDAFCRSHAQFNPVLLI
jgi:hypothetical protein